MTQKHRRKTHTIEYLSQAFWDIYNSKPVNQITVKELTERAGVHRSSFYGHFDNIYEFLYFEEEKLLEGIEGFITCQPVRESDISLLQRIIEYYQQNLPRLSLLCGESGDPGFPVKLRQRIVPALMEYLQIPQNDKEVYYILDFIVNGMLSFLTTWYRREGKMPSADTLSSIRDALINGCRAALIQRSSDSQTIERFMDIIGLE